MKVLVTRLVNNGLVREDRLGRMFVLKSGPTYGDARRAFGEDLDRWEPIIEKITDLFVRMNTERAEIMAMVLFTAYRLAEERRGQPSEKDVVDAVMAWKPRRRPVLDSTVGASTVRNLAALAWLKVNASEDLPFPEATAIEVSR